MALKTDPFAELEEEAIPEPVDTLAAELAAFTPKKKTVAPEEPEEEAGLTILAEKHGFSINNLEEKRRSFRSRRAPRVPKTMPITMRVRVADWNKFQIYCEEGNYTVAQGFERLMQAIGIRKDADQSGYFDPVE
jgi:hypothetical protein